MRNPMPIMLDRLGAYRGAYRVSMRSGLRLELRAGAGDRFGFFEVLLRGDYTEFGQSISPGDVVVDIGANVGCFTLLASRMVGPTGRVIAIEPERRAFEQLERNIELNAACNVLPRQVALGARDGEITFYTGSSSLFGSLYPGDGQTPSQTVRMVTLASLMDEVAIDRCDYMKIDCEGGEYDILASLPSRFAERIKQISIEVHRIPGHHPREVHERLRAFGFREISQEHVYYFRRD